MVRPTVDDLKRWLQEPLADALGYRFGKIEISLLSQRDTVADGTTVLQVRDAAGRLRAVVLCSVPAAPDMVKRAMTRAHQAKAILGATAGAPILDPLADGCVQGLSYAVLPYCNGLSETPPLWWIQRSLLRPSILQWLRRVTECTVREVEPDAVDRSFAEPLRRVVALRANNGLLRIAAESSAERLRSGAWTPRHVLMHGDLWKGNILIRSADLDAEHRGWRDRFAIIDWAGSEIHGYAMYDLVRLARSMHMNARSLREEIERHCRLLQCEAADASSYLMAALGHVLMNLEHFPIDRYTSMAVSCLETLDHAFA